MKKLIEAYSQGRNGENEKPRGLLPRVAHGLGRKAAAADDRYNESIEMGKRQEFTDAWQAATGLNKELFSVLDIASRIPHQAQSDTTRSYTWTDEERNKYSVWSVSFGFGANTDDPEKKTRTPLVPKKKQILIDSVDWAHNGFSAPVSDIGFTVYARRAEDGSINGVHSDITINQQPYDPDSIELDDRHEFTGGVSFTVGEDGQIKNIGTTSSSQTGYVDRDPASVQADLDKFLPWLQSAARQTADIYASLDDSADQLPAPPSGDYIDEPTDVDTFEQGTDDRKKVFSELAPSYITAAIHESNPKKADEIERQYKKVLENDYGIKLPDHNVNNFLNYFLADPEKTAGERSLIDVAYNIDDPTVIDTTPSAELIVKLRDQEPDLFAACQLRARDSLHTTRNNGGPFNVESVSSSWELDAALQLVIERLETYPGYSEEALKELFR